MLSRSKEIISMEEEQREESKFDGDCRQYIEDVAVKGLSLSSKAETLDDEVDDVPQKEYCLEDANTVENSGVCHVSGNNKNSNDGDSATGDGNTCNSVSHDVASGEESSKKTLSTGDVVRTDAITELETEISKMKCEGDAGTVMVKLVDEIESCDDVQRFSKTVNLVEVEMNDETANMKLIPTDLIIEIFSRLPAKSVGRFRSLSKLWCSILGGPDFIELFQSRSCARPKVLFGVERRGVWWFFSSPQTSSSLVVDADFHTRFSQDIGRFTCSYASGLLYFRDLYNPRVGQLFVVCNPVTGQYVTLPDVDMYCKSRGFLGFDPVEKKFKVLAEGNPFGDQRDHHEVLTLGAGELSWRKKKIDCLGYRQSWCDGICINGVLYYLVSSGKVVQFDYRSEEFKFVIAECFSDSWTQMNLINYKGKLGGINCSYGEADGMYTLELRLCVLEGVERHKWSTYVYTLPENELIDDPSEVSVAGVTATGEIILAMDYTCKPYYVFYFNPQRNTLQSVEIKGFGAELEAVKYRGRVHVFVDHVEHLDVEVFKYSRVKHICSTCEAHIEDMDVNNSKRLELSIFTEQVKRFCANCEEQEKRERQ